MVFIPSIQDSIVRMVDVGYKPMTQRWARARAKIHLVPSTIALITKGVLLKGDILAIAKVAGIMAAKRTSELIPLCHPLSLTSVRVDIIIEKDGIFIESEVSTMAVTGVEMEAMTAATVTGLAIYDVVKSIDDEATIEKVWLVKKSGGKSGEYYRDIK